MAFRIHNTVVRGEITNEIPGIVTGRLWVLGRRHPVVLQLQGNCHPDLAGCALTFRNAIPPTEELEGLAAVQEGDAGDMTASRKALIPTVSDDEQRRLVQLRQPVPTRCANCLYLEWTSAANGLVILETEVCELSITEPRWVLPPTASPGATGMHDDEDEEEDVDDGFNDDDDDYEDFPPFDDDDEDDIGFDDEDDEDDADFDEAEGEDDEDEDGFDNRFGFGDPEDDRPLDEFEWERELREADRRADAYQEALERYQDHLDEQPQKTTPASEGKKDRKRPAAAHKTRDDEDEFDGHHYLTARALDLALLLQKSAEIHGVMTLDDAAGAPDGKSRRPGAVYTAVANSIQLAGKLAAALDGLAHGVEPEPGFVIAMLKRALVPLNNALHGCCGAIDTFGADRRELVVQLRGARDELFEIRREILDLMADLRALL